MKPKVSDCCLAPLDTNGYCMRCGNQAKSIKYVTKKGGANKNPNTEALFSLIMFLFFSITVATFIILINL